MSDSSRAWLVFWLVAIANFTNYYVFDSIGPVVDLLQRQLGYTDTQVGLLSAVYSLPNIVLVLVLVGGVLVDRFGAAIVTVLTAVVCLAGAILTAFPSFEVMLAGRFLFGVGGETLALAATVVIVQYFPPQRVAFALGLSLGLSRAGSWCADMSPTWFAEAYARGWQAPLIIAAVMAAATLVAALAYWLVDRAARPAAAPVHEPMRMAEVRQLGTAYWMLLVLCVLWYAAIVAFRSTFAVKYFQHAHGLALDRAGALNGHVFLASIFATPVFGWLCSRTGRYSPFLVFAAVLFPLSLFVMVRTEYIGFATVLIGISYCMLPAVIWPLLSRLVPKRIFGTALGLMWIAQNAGIGGANVVAGWLNDRAGASAANPAAYLPMMELFIGMGLGGLLAAALFWKLAGRRRHEVLEGAPVAT